MFECYDIYIYTKVFYHPLDNLLKLYDSQKFWVLMIGYLNNYSFDLKNILLKDNSLVCWQD